MLILILNLFQVRAHFKFIKTFLLQTPNRLWPRLTLHWLCTPFFQLAMPFKNEGELLYFGSSYGLFAFTLALLKPNAIIIGCDQNQERIQFSRKILGSFARLQFKHSHFALLSGARKESLTGISMLHLLQSFSSDDQKLYLKQAYQALTPDGVLTFNILSQKYSILEWKTFAELAGFQVSVHCLSLFPYSNHFFICKK